MVYAHDPRDRIKQERARKILDRLAATKSGALSAQSLSEFFSVTTRKLRERIAVNIAFAQVQRFARTFDVLPLTEPVVLEGCRASIEHQLSVWDALIWSVARLNQVPYVLTEDMEHDRLLEGVRFLNPFSPAFDLSLVGIES